MPRACPQVTASSALGSSTTPMLMIPKHICPAQTTLPNVSPTLNDLMNSSILMSKGTCEQLQKWSHFVFLPRNHFLVFPVLLLAPWSTRQPQWKHRINLNVILWHYPLLLVDNPINLPARTEHSQNNYQYNCFPYVLGYVPRPPVDA